jgi:hypothetical protein
MLRKAIYCSAGEPSFFYLMMAEGCFQRAISARDPKYRSPLREMGRNYLAKAISVASLVLESQPTQLRSSTTACLNADKSS